MAVLHPLRPDCLRRCSRWRSLAAARVRHEAHHADGAGVYVDAVRLHENGVTYGNVERSGASATAENEKPSLAVRSQAPSGVWRQIDPFEHECGTGNEKSPFVGEPVRLHPEIGRFQWIAAFDRELWAKVGDGMSVSWGCSTPPLFHRRCYAPGDVGVAANLRHRLPYR